MNYNQETIEICQRIVKETNKYNLRTHEMYQSILDNVISETKSFPNKITISQKIRAIAEDDPCVCRCCGKVHGVVNTKFCSKKCYIKHKIENKNPNAHIEWKNRVAEKRFENSQEGVDYVVCAICGRKAVDLSLHVTKVHNIERIDYIEKYGKVFADCVSERVKGENNPAYQHGGKFSPFSKNFIHGYDEEWHKEQLKKNSEYMNENPGVFQYEYYLNMADGDEELAKELYVKHQSKTLDYFIDLYGEKEGARRHKSKTEKWMKTLNEKSEEELADINSRKIRKSGCFYSKSEKELFSTLKEHLPNMKSELSLYRGEFDGKKKFYIYDMYLDNKIIEYNGDFWHANPNRYDESFVSPYTNKTASEIWEKDKDKIKIAEKNGFEVMVVWEHDYKQDPQKVVQECISYLTQ